MSGIIEKIKDNTNFNLFNYRKYYLSQKIYNTMKLSNSKLIDKNKNIVYKLKTYLNNRIDKLKSSNYIKTFILGDNSIDKEILNTYRVNGIIHLFSISGMHISFISFIILFILNSIKKTKYNYIIVIIFLLFYVVLTNYIPSVIRSSLLFCLIFLNKTFNINLSLIKIILLILFLNLIANPFYIYNIGFIFSYTISIYLIGFRKLFINKKNYFIKLFNTSLISFLVSIPILINNYFSINVLSIFLNVLFIPLITFIIFPLSFIVLILPVFDSFYYNLLQIFELLSEFFISFKIELVLAKVSIFIIIFYYILITFILYMFFYKKYYYLLILFIVLIIHNKKNYFSNSSYITFLDQTTTNMIQELKGIFARKPLISIGI